MECSDLSELWIDFGRGASRIARDTGRLAPYHYCGGGCAWDRTARAVPLLWGRLRVGPDGSRRTAIVGAVAGNQSDQLTANYHARSRSSNINSASIKIITLKKKR